MMKIFCTKEEFRQMAVNCSEGNCSACVFKTLCNESNFSGFVEGIECTSGADKECDCNAGQTKMQTGYI